MGILLPFCESLGNTSISSNILLGRVLQQLYAQLLKIPSTPGLIFHLSLNQNLKRNALLSGIGLVGKYCRIGITIPYVRSVINYIDSFAS